MTELSPFRQRQALVESTRAEASRLMSSVTHETMKDQVLLATRDLDEAARWLRQENIDERPHILTIVDLALQLAASRLAAVDHALHTYGPNAMRLG